MKTLKETPDFDELMGIASAKPIEDVGTETNETPELPPESENPANDTEQVCDNTGCRIWNRFMTHLSEDGDGGDKSTRMACKIDRELAETLDEIDISRRCRSDLVNAIVKSFLDFHLSDLSAYRRKSASLLKNIAT